MLPTNLKERIIIEQLDKDGYSGSIDIDSIFEIGDYILVDVDDVNKGRVNVRLLLKTIDDIVEFVEKNNIDLDSAKGKMLFDLNFNSRKVVDAEQPAMKLSSGAVEMISNMSISSGKKKRSKRRI